MLTKNNKAEILKNLDSARVQMIFSLSEQRGLHAVDVIAELHMHKRLKCVWGVQRPLHWNTVGCQDVTVLDILSQHHQNSPA